MIKLLSFYKILIIKKNFIYLIYIYYERTFKFFTSNS